ncbi:hypothetical protein JB92DRAFT_3143659 [Gautieria morchelliformis]|nr:hypothetical protein JB92DRAFT_3143659 [Gautieria morchelliformis]
MILIPSTAPASLPQDMANMGIEGDRLRQLPSIHSLGIPLSLAEVLAMPPLDDKDPITLPPLRCGPQPSPSASAWYPMMIPLSRQPHSGAVRTKKKRPKKGSGLYTLPKHTSVSPMSGSMLNSSSEPATSGTSDIVARRGAQPDPHERLVWRVEPGVVPVPQDQAGQGDEGREEESSRRMEPKKFHFHHHHFDEYGGMTQ